MAKGDESANQSQANEAAAKEEYNYIKALIDSNMPDLASPVIAEAKKKWPILGPKLRVLELQTDLSQGQFDKVNKIAEAIPDKKSGEYWAIRLSMAEAYFARQRMDECAKIYKAFFAAVPKPGPELRDFYVESAFKWAQMLIHNKQFDEALKVFTGLLELNVPIEKRSLPEERWCTIAMDTVDLQLRLASEIEIPEDAKAAKAAKAKRNEYLKAAEKIVDALLWKTDLIIVFGKAVSMKAHIKLLRGDSAGAQDLVNEFMPQLAEIHNSLVEQDPKGRLGYVRLSPMPACRYLLAKMLWDSVQEEMKKPKPDKAKMADALFGAKKGGKRNNSGSYNHAINVFVKYPESTWASDAGELAEKIAVFVKEEYGKEIKTNISSDQKRKVRQMQFANAYELFRGNNFEKAIDAYADILRQFPETEESIGAVANMAASYLELLKNAKTPEEKNLIRIYADTVENYLCERFSGLKSDYIRPAGDEVLRLAASERDNGALARSAELYDSFFENYPTHYNAAAQAYVQANAARKVEDWDLAICFYSRIANTYTNHAAYVPSLHSLAACYEKVGNEAEYLKYLRAFSKNTKKLNERVVTKLVLAQRQQKAGFACFAKAAETNDAAAVEALNKEAYKNVALAIRDFRDVSKDIENALASKSVTDEKEKQNLTKRHEQAMYLEGDSWQRLRWPESKISTFRQAAVKAYEKYIATYPKGEFAPPVMVKIGTIWTAEKNMEKAQDAFARLQSNYPDSDEAKNSVPRLARTLIDMGLKAEGVEQYRKMISNQDGKYTTGQFLQAGEALLEAKSFDIAQEAYAKVIEMAKKTSSTNMITIAMMGNAKALFGTGRFAEAHEVLDTFIEKYPKSTLVVDAYTMLVDVASEEGRKEKDDELRKKYFNQAVGAIKKLRNYKRNKADQDVLDLESGDILVRKMEAEEAMNLKEQAKETCMKAIATFQVFLMANEPTQEYPFKDMTPAQRNNLERCYATILPLMAKVGKDQSENVIKYANVYLELFPNGKNKTAVQNALNQAKAE